MGPVAEGSLVRGCSISFSSGIGGSLVGKVPIRSGVISMGSLDSGVGD